MFPWRSLFIIANRGHPTALPLTVIVLVIVTIMLVPMMIDDNGDAYDNDGADDGF